MLKALSESVWLNKRLRSELHHLFSLSYGGVFSFRGVFLSRAVLLGEIYPFGGRIFAGRCIYKPNKGCGF